MGIKIKSAGEIAGKWARVTPQRAADYQAGVKDTSVDWAGPTKAAEGRYEQGVQEAITKKRFGSGVSAAGTEKWRSKTEAVGVQRWPQGVRVAENDYEKGFAPYRDVIEGVSLPEKFAKGDPRNYDRVVAVGTALHTKKVGS